MDLLWQYVVVFLTAAIPMVEVMIVIPASVAAGLHPIPVGLVALAGNASTLVLAVVGGDELISRLRHRRGDRPVSRRHERVRRISYRWGLPGVALLGPIAVGSHTAALAAIALRLPRGRVLAWSLGGLTAWTTVFVALSAWGRAVL